MKSLNEITTDIKSYAENLGLEGAYSDILSKILAYGIYTKNAEIYPIITELSPRDSTKLNSKIFFSLILGRSISRGHVPIVEYKNMYSTIDVKFEPFDYCTSTNGYYFYYVNDTEYKMDSQNLKFYITSKEIISDEFKIEDIEYESYIDIPRENISEDLIILAEVENSDELDKRLWTSNSKDFFSTNIYSYLVVTLPNYSLRIYKKAEDSWNCKKLIVKMLSYNETYPSNLDIAIPYFTRNADDENRNNELTPAKIREFDLDSIIDNSLRYYSSRESVASTSDLVDNFYLLYSDDDTQPIKYFSVQYSLGYILVSWSYIGKTEYRQSFPAILFSSFDEWSKTVEVNESLLEYNIENIKNSASGTDLQLDIIVNKNDPITEADITKIRNTIISEYSGKVLLNSWLVYEVMRCGATKCTIKFGEDFIDEQNILGQGVGHLFYGKGHEHDQDPHDPDPFIYDINLSTTITTFNDRNGNPKTVDPCIVPIIPSNLKLNLVFPDN